jgi:hypothetical protein
VAACQKYVRGKLEIDSKVKPVYAYRPWQFDNLIVIIPFLLCGSYGVLKEKCVQARKNIAMPLSSHQIEPFL